MKKRKAFTLIEVLISVALIAIVLIALYRSLDIQESANRHLYHFLQKTLNRDKAVMVLYRDIVSSDGNLSIHKGEFDTLCISHTLNSLYDMDMPKVCWLVMKDKNELVRVEGGYSYKLPLKIDDRVAIDRVLPNMELFDIYSNSSDILVVLKSKGEKSYTFLVHNIKHSYKIKKTKSKTKKL